MCCCQSVVRNSLPINPIFQWDQALYTWLMYYSAWSQTPSTQKLRKVDISDFIVCNARIIFSLVRYCSCMNPSKMSTCNLDSWQSEENQSEVTWRNLCAARQRWPPLLTWAAHTLQVWCIPVEQQVINDPGSPSKVPLCPSFLGFINFSPTHL